MDKIRLPMIYTKSTEYAKRGTVGTTEFFLFIKIMSERDGREEILLKIKKLKMLKYFLICHLVYEICN